MRALHRLGLVIASLALIACSDDSGTNPDTGPVTQASATIAPKGGSVSVEGENGTSLKVTFPGGAVLSPTLVRLRAIDPPAGVRARFVIEPAGLDLNRPATFVVTLPSGVSVRANDALVFTSGEAVHVTTENDAVNRTLTATLYHLGFELGEIGASQSRAFAAVGGDDSEFIDVDQMECDIVREALDLQILRAQAFSSAFPPDLATPLIQEYRAALLVCESPDSVAAATQILQEYACSNVNSAEAQSSAVPIETADDLERALGMLVAAEGISELVGADCSVQTESIASVFDRYLTAYIDRINAPGFTRSTSDWDGLWKELQKVMQVKALADEFEVFRAQQRITTELFPALFARVRDVANTACDEDENNSFLLDLVQGGHPLSHPMTAVPQFPDFTGFTQGEVVDEMLTCGASFEVEARTSQNDLVGTTEVLVGESGNVRVTDVGKLIIIDNTLGFTCNGIVSRAPMRVRAEVPGSLPVVQIGNLSGSMTVNMATTLAALPQVENEPPSSFDLVIERDRNMCGIDETGVIELARISVSAEGFVGTMAGEWQGGCPAGPVNGTFSIQILDNGDVAGGFDGSASGDIIGHVNANGTFDASANGTAGDCVWQGTLNLNDGVVSGSGTWSCGGAGCSGSYQSGFATAARR